MSGGEPVTTVGWPRLHRSFLYISDISCRTGRVVTQCQVTRRRVDDWSISQRSVTGAMSRF